MDFTKTNIDKDLIAKIPNASESVRENNTEHHSFNSKLPGNERIMEEVHRYLYFSKDTINKLKTVNIMLQLEVRVKEKRIAVAEQDVREKDATIERFKTQLCDMYDGLDKSKAECNQDNTSRGNPPELKYA